MRKKSMIFKWVLLACFVLSLLGFHYFTYAKDCNCTGPHGGYGYCEGFGSTLKSCTPKLPGHCTNLDCSVQWDCICENKKPFTTSSFMYCPGDCDEGGGWDPWPWPWPWPPWPI